MDELTFLLRTRTDRFQQEYLYGNVALLGVVIFIRRDPSQPGMYRAVVRRRIDSSSDESGNPRGETPEGGPPSSDRSDPRKPK